jgi:cold shock CspA family protein
VRSVVSRESPIAPSERMGCRGTIHSLKEGYGFILPSSGGSTLFFFHGAVLNADFNELRVGEEIEYELGRNSKGECAINVRVAESTS